MDGPPCKACSHPESRRVPREGFLVTTFSIIYLYPYRCQHCYTRFISFRRGVRYDEEHIDRRQLDRKAVEFEGVARHLEHGEFPVVVTDLSPEGCQCTTQQPLAEGDEFDLGIYVVPGETPIHALCKVQRRQSEEAYGLTFRKIGATEWHIIRHYLEGH